MTTAAKKVVERVVTKTFYLGYNDGDKTIYIYDYADGPSDDGFDRSQPLKISFVLPQKPADKNVINLGRVVVKD